MRLKILLPLLLLVLLPLGAFGWLGVRMSVEQRAEIEAQFDTLLSGRLEARAHEIARAMTLLERRLDAQVDAFYEPDAEMRRVLRRSVFPHALRFDPKGVLVFPPPSGPKSAEERRFLGRTESLWRDGWVAPNMGESDAVTRDRGWRLWYWGGGLNLLYWRQAGDGATTAVEVDRARLLDWVLRSLPSSEDGDPTSRVALLDAAGHPLYQWGGLEPTPETAPLLSRPLASPLSGWRLTWHGDRPPGDGVSYGVFLGLAAVGLALLGLAVYFYRASGAELRTASQRVSFVNQVSHELKTPLTNIRMYAELLEAALESPPSGVQRHLRVIVNESERLTRLIANVLTFARDEREGLTLHRTTSVVDDVVRSVIDAFAPRFRRAALEVNLVLGAAETVVCDQDAIGQIVGNLLSNVEKYAGDGGQVWISTHQEPGWTTVDVRDAGPGIPRAQREQVFVPFHRLSDALEEGVSGTGIGLGIARRLARLHGGDLHLLDCDTGAHFRVRIRTEASS